MVFGKAPPHGVWIPLFRVVLASSLSLYYSLVYIAVQCPSGCSAKHHRTGGGFPSSVWWSSPLSLSFSTKLRLLRVVVASSLSLYYGPIEIAVDSGCGVRQSTPPRGVFSFLSGGGRPPPGGGCRLSLSLSTIV